MKRCLKAIALALLLSVMTCAVALGAAGKVREKVVKLPEDVMINGTLLKQGTYKMKFDEETGELSFIKDKTTVAKTTARLEQRQRKASALEFGLDPLRDGKALRSITFAGDKQKFVLVDGNQ